MDNVDPLGRSIVPLHHEKSALKQGLPSVFDVDSSLLVSNLLFPLTSRKPGWQHP